MTTLVHSNLTQASDTTTAAAPSGDLAALKSRLKATWMAGNYDYFSRFMETSAVELLARLGVPPGATLLDVACGSGQLALLAARGGAKVTGVDIAENSIKAARGRAQVDGLDARFDEGDAEALAYADGSFDVVATIYGAMFAPRPELVAKELARVCRPGGTIAMANWTREGFIGRLLATVGKFVSPPGMPSPVLWGDPDVVRERFGTSVSALVAASVHYRFDYPFSPGGVVDFFRENYGPMARAFDGIAADAGRRLHADLVALWDSENESTEPGRTVVSAEYLEVIATRA